MNLTIEINGVPCKVKVQFEMDEDLNVPYIDHFEAVDCESFEILAFVSQAKIETAIWLAYDEAKKESQEP